MNVYTRPCRRYGLSNLIGDWFMTIVTGGLWLIWILIRELRPRPIIYIER